MKWQRPTQKKDDYLKGSENLLFVDDEKMICKFAERLLGQLGYAVTTCQSPVEALRLFQSDPDCFDMVISDVTMPELTGDKLARKLLAIRPDIPVILCTGYSRIVHEESFAEIGIKAVAYKPLAMGELALKIREVLAAQQ